MAREQFRCIGQIMEIVKMADGYIAIDLDRIGGKNIVTVTEFGVDQMAKTAMTADDLKAWERKIPFYQADFIGGMA